MKSYLLCNTTLTASLLLCGAACRADLPPLSPTAVASGAQISRAYGQEFVTVGAPGNAPDAGGQGGVNAGSGGVAAPFRIARTEVTNTQWVDFANAYLPHIQGDPGRQWGILGSMFVQFDSGLGRYVVDAGAEQYAASMSWRMAARYCNWLCNDQRTGAAAFENGAYDTSTFGSGPSRTSTDQITHNPGAQFYLPTRDQWVKAAFYDPNRNTAGQGGYWTYPNASDRELRYGFPQDGGESIVGLDHIPPFSWYLPVGSYANTQSPWGLFDLSGGSCDWNEDSNDGRSVRLFSGTERRDAVPWASDSLYYSSGSAVFPDELFTISGLRVAAVVPSPSTLTALFAVGIFGVTSRKRLNRE